MLFRARILVVVVVVVVCSGGSGGCINDMHNQQISEKLHGSYRNEVLIEEC